MTLPTPAVEVFVPPSAEARCLMRHLPGFVMPQTPLARVLRDVLVSPYSQLTLLSFDLQHYLYGIFHTSRTARIGHTLGGAGVLMFSLQGLEALAPGWGAPLVIGVLLVWYAAMARSAGLWLWWPVSAAALFALWWLGGALLVERPWLWALASGAVISTSHAAEPFFPPRAGHPSRWLRLPEFMAMAKGPVHRLGLGLRVSSFVFTGWLQELWAAPRLFPYELLELMFAFGYAPQLRAELHHRVARAWASGAPAIDFVGIGGGVSLRPEQAGEALGGSA